jgi:NitT/TauT family transport system permease protein
MKSAAARAEEVPLQSAGDAGRAPKLKPAIARGWRRAASARPVLLPVLLTTAAGLMWEFGARAAHLSSMIIVPPSAVWQVITASPGILLQQSLPTVQETLISFAVASVVGVFLGAGLILSHRVRQAFYPHILIFQLIPKVALAPLFIVWFGVGPESRLSLAVFMAFFPVVISTAAGLMSADRQVVRMAVSAMASQWQIFYSIRVPYAVPHIFAGLKVAVTMAMIGVIVGEFVTAQAGLGYIIMMGASSAETALMLAAIAFLCIAGLLLYGAVALAEWLIERRMGVSITSDEF